MPTFKKCDQSVLELAAELLTRFDTHRPLLDARVKFDFLFAFPALDENGEPKGNAITKNGVKALGLCRIVSLKDRAKGLGDVEITLDGEWWENASDEEKAALLDHELHHASVKTQNGVLIPDDLGRPMIKLRKHDFEVGWFHLIAERHGEASQERQQAFYLRQKCGQLYWPELMGRVLA
jgi:hypothetical protein